MLTAKGMRFPIDVILVCIRWYAAYPLSYRHLKEMMEESGVFVDHFSINRWAIRFLPFPEKVFRKHKPWARRVSTAGVRVQKTAARKQSSLQEAQAAQRTRACRK